VAPAIVVLGMHRSGTSCLAGMLASAGLASAGSTVRNWDNVRGHHEMLDLVRLNEAVLAHSSAHYRAPPTDLRWTDAHAALRDQLLCASIDGRPALLKDPRMLLTLPFWRASTIPFCAIGIVRHPLAVARSLATWRELPLIEGVALWLAHNQALAADHGPVIDFDQPADVIVAAVAALFDCDASLLAAAYDEQLVHHDDGDPPVVPGLDEAVALYRQLGGQGHRRAHFPRRELAVFDAKLREGDREAAVTAARAAIDVAPDRGAVLVPVMAALLRVRAHAEARVVLDHASLDDTGLLDLLRGKLALAVDDAAVAVTHLEAACAVTSPLYQARHLLPHALRRANRLAEARTALERVVTEALYPHGPLATLAEWSFLDGDHTAAVAGMARAIEAAPLHRRGRLRTRRAEWLRAAGDPAAARAELERAVDEDPTYARSRELLGETVFTRGVSIDPVSASTPHK